MKTPDEIKKGLEYCTTKVKFLELKVCDLDCPYRVEGLWCRNALSHDTLAHIQQLEAKVPKWMNDEGSILCPYCGATMRMIPAWQATMPDMGGFVWKARGKCPACGSITPETHGRTAKEANEAAFAAAQWGHVPLPEPPVEV